MEGKNCLRCGTGFGCGASDEKGRCWCAELPPVMPVIDASCLCPPCLKEEISALIKEAGLCASCAHAQRLSTKGGSIIYLCGLSKSDGRFAKYPRLPMAECPGYQPAVTAACPQH